MSRIFAPLLVLLATAAPALAATKEATVYKSPSCGCCTGWVEHLRRDGFHVTVIDRDDLDPVKNRLGVPRSLRSCHTAMIGGYVVEGHVPAAVIDRLLAEKPRVAGLAAPGMPQSAPGMDGPPGPNPVTAFGPGQDMRPYAP